MIVAVPAVCLGFSLTCSGGGGRPGDPEDPTQTLTHGPGSPRANGTGGAAHTPWGWETSAAKLGEAGGRQG